MKNLEWLNMALCMKSMWMEINGSGLWNMVMEDKYLRKLAMVDWIRKEEHSVQNSLIIWNGFMRVLGWIYKSMCWKARNDEDVQIGINPIIGMEATLMLYESLISYL